jgi:hypothetical protein
MAISEMPTYESVYAQMSHRDLRKPSYSDSGYLAFGRYKDVCISPSRKIKQSSIFSPIGNLTTSCLVSVPYSPNTKDF